MVDIGDLHACNLTDNFASVANKTCSVNGKCNRSHDTIIINGTNREYIQTFYCECLSGFYGNGVMCSSISEYQWSKSIEIGFLSAGAVIAGIIFLVIFKYGGQKLYDVYNKYKPELKRRYLMHKILKHQEKRENLKDQKMESNKSSQECQKGSSRRASRTMNHVEFSCCGCLRYFNKTSVTPSDEFWKSDIFSPY